MAAADRTNTVQRDHVAAGHGGRREHEREGTEGVALDRVEGRGRDAHDQHRQREGPVGRGPATERDHDERDQHEHPRKMEPGSGVSPVEETASGFPESGERIGEPAPQPGPLLDAYRQHPVAEPHADPAQVHPRAGGGSECGNPAEEPFPRVHRTQPPQRLDRGRDDQEDADGSNEPGEEAGQRRPPPAARAQAEEHGHGQQRRRGFGVPEHQDVGGRRDGDEPCGTASECVVTGLEPRQLVEQRAERQRRGIDDDQEDRARGDAAHLCPTPREQGDEREEAEGFVGERGVTLTRDPHVPGAVPHEQALVGRARRGGLRRFDTIDDEPGERQCRQDDRSRRDPPRERGTQRAPTPSVWADHQPALRGPWLPPRRDERDTNPAFA